YQPPHAGYWHQTPLVTRPTMTNQPTPVADHLSHTVTQLQGFATFLRPQYYRLTGPETLTVSDSDQTNQLDHQLKLVQHPPGLVLSEQQRTLTHLRYRLHTLFLHPGKHRLHVALQLLSHLVLLPHRQLTKLLIFHHHQPVGSHLSLSSHHQRLQIPPKLVGRLLKRWLFHHHVH